MKHLEAMLIEQYLGSPSQCDQIFWFLCLELQRASDPLPLSEIQAQYEPLVTDPEPLTLSPG